MLTLWGIFFPFRWLAAVALAVILHELSHMAVCRVMGIKVLGIKALPWGLTASTPLMYEPLSQLAVSVSGPMCNFFLLFFCPVIKRYLSPETSDLFALANLADGLLNLLPALPLDGGIILKSFLCAKFGLVRGFSHMLKITAATGAVIMLFGIHILVSTGSNVSYLVAGIFIMYNLRHEKELNMCVRKRILTGEIKSRPYPKRISADFDSNAICLVDMISPAHTISIDVTKDKKLIGTVGQEKLLNHVLKNSTITLGECIEKK